MKLCFAEAYTLKEDNWATEIIGYSAEQLPNNEPPGSCPKNRQDCLKEKGPHRGWIINRYQTNSDRSPKGFPVRRGRDIGQAPFLLQGDRGIQGFRDSLSPNCTGSRQTAEYRELLPALLRPPNPASESSLRRRSPGRSPSRKRCSFARQGDIRILRETKKGQTLRSDLEEAATYSPTGKPQYHRRE